MRARVGAMPLPKGGSQHDNQPPQVQGSNRVRVHSGMSLEVSCCISIRYQPLRRPPQRLQTAIGHDVAAMGPFGRLF